jgi:DMSO/TMAO reductase YedYZ molybdopterin-dependent catalytic subunit
VRPSYTLLTMSETEPGPPIPVTSRPLNAETPLPALTRPLTPVSSFYVRSHFDIPRIDREGWKLRIDGSVDRPTQLDLRELLALPAHEVWATLECAGNGRQAMRPPPPGLPWGFGAVATGRFSGVSLSVLLDRAGLRSGATEVVFEGADRGAVETGDVVPFARSLPLDVASHPDTLVAHSLNGRPLPFEHGFPARLIVPNWYAMASVKWLVDIRVVDGAFEGFFQKDEYTYAETAASTRPEPVSLMRVRAVIGIPADGDEVPPGAVEIAGTAWSGHSPVEVVEISLDGGGTWGRTQLAPVPSPYAARPWRCTVQLDAGRYTILARATDHAGNTQPIEPIRNARGYGNNVIHRVRVTVTEAPKGREDDVLIVRPRSRPVPA